VSGPGPRPPPLARAHHLDEETRYRAVLALDPGRPAELEELLARLDDESWRVRSAAVERLGSAGDPAAVLPGLLAALDAGASAGGREAAASALARLGPPALAPLVERLGASEVESDGAVAVLEDTEGNRFCVIGRG